MVWVSLLIEVVPFFSLLQCFLFMVQIAISMVFIWVAFNMCLWLFSTLGYFFKHSIDSIHKTILRVRIPLSLHVQNHTFRLLRRLKCIWVVYSTNAFQWYNFGGCRPYGPPSCLNYGQHYIHHLEGCRIYGPPSFLNC